MNKCPNCGIDEDESNINDNSIIEYKDDEYICTQCGYTFLME